MPFATSQVEGDVKNSNAGKTITNHPPVITIFIGGMNHSQSWVVYGIVLATLHTSNRNEWDDFSIFLEVTRAEHIFLPKQVQFPLENMVVGQLIWLYAIGKATAHKTRIL